MASASPTASMAVELEVGARLSGHASRGTFTSTWMSASRARVERGLPVRETIRAPIRFRLGRSRETSSVSPL